MMKKWVVLAYDQYYPSGGLGDIRSAHYTKEEADETVTDQLIADHDYVEVVDIEEYLNNLG